MPVKYRVFHDPTLVYVRYSGYVETHEIIDELSRFCATEKGYGGQPHLFDLSRVISYSVDYQDFFRLMGHLVDAYHASFGEHLCVFLAPDGVPAQFGNVLRKSYLGSQSILIRLARTVGEATDILGTHRADLIAHIALHSETTKSVV